MTKRIEVTVKIWTYEYNGNLLMMEAETSDEAMAKAVWHFMPLGKIRKATEQEIEFFQEDGRESPRKDDNDALDV